jgi:mono/diheme cytochrome c family protein
MKRILFTILLTLLGVLIVEAAGWFVFLYSGTYSISTYNHDNGPINWALDTGMTRSAIRHARGIQAPQLTDPAMIQMGFQHYHEMCVACHGAPGVATDEIARGLWPKAPNLARTVPDWTPAQLFWITKNGIKFTAMPAWGPTHSEEEIWAMVAFLEKLPQLSPADYHKMEQKLRNGAPQNQMSDHHEHTESGKEP